MVENDTAYQSEQFVNCFAMPNCSMCKYFEVIKIFEYCNLYDTTTDGKICNGFRIKNANA